MSPTSHPACSAHAEWISRFFKSMQWLQHKKARSHTEVMSSPPQNHFHQPRQLVKEPIMKVIPDQYSIWKPCYCNFYRCGQIFFDNLFVPHAVIFFGLNTPLLEIIKEEISHLESILKLFISNMRDFFFFRVLRIWLYPHLLTWALWIRIHDMLCYNNFEGWS